MPKLLLGTPPPPNFFGVWGGGYILSYITLRYRLIMGDFFRMSFWTQYKRTIRSKLEEWGWNTSMATLGLMHAIFLFVESCSNPNTEYNIAQAAEVLYYIVLLQGFNEHLNLDFEPQPATPSKATLLMYAKNIARLVHRRKFTEQDKLNFRQETAEHINNLMAALVGYSGKDLKQLGILKMNEIV